MVGRARGARSGAVDGAEKTSLDSTLVFPLSGNPIGFNHFALAEGLLRRVAGLEAVLFVLSNGRHPDPTKADATVPAEERQHIAQLALDAVADPARSYLARQAELAGDSMRLSPASMQISPLEFGFTRAVRTAELIPRLRKRHPTKAERLNWCVGTDLLLRMADRRIFRDADLAVLAKGCHYHVVERPDLPEAPTVQAALKQVADARGVRLTATAHAATDLPAWLAPFLHVSSTRIRHAAEAGDPLGGMLPAPAADRLHEQGHYAEGSVAARLVGPAGAELGTRSELALAVEALQGDLFRAGEGLATALLAQREANLPHSFAAVESSVGGLITDAMARRSGASRYLRQTRFAYDLHAKTTLLAEAGLPAAAGSAVSEQSVRALARALRTAAQADYALAESGMAGPPDPSRRSLKSGQCWIAVAGPRGERTAQLDLNPFLTRREHQLLFARHALDLATATVLDAG